MKTLIYSGVFSLLILAGVSAQLIQKIPLIKKAQNRYESKISNLVLNACALLQSAGKQEIETISGYSNDLYQIDRQGNIRVTISCGENWQPVLDDLKAMYGKIEAVDRGNRIIVAWLAPQKILNLAKLNAVLNIKETERGHLKTGTVNSEGDAILKADQVRSILGVTGSGIKVGVISDGCDTRATPQASGDLPSVIDVLDNSAGGDEGTAMMEIVYDLSPGSALGFSQGISSSTAFINSVNNLVGASCDVIVDDIGFFSQPYFEDGSIAQAVQNAVLNNGVVYASSAGNSQDEHYEGDFSSAGSQLGFNDVHDFGGGDYLQQITLTADQNFAIFLQWNDPFGSSTNDYTMRLVMADEVTVYSFTPTKPNSNDPYMYFSLSSTGVLTINVMIIRNAGAASRRVELTYNFGASASVNEFNNLPGSINGHSAVPEIISTGAVRYSTPSTIEYFSSIGPSRIYSYPSYSFVDRAKPDLVAVDGNQITGAGGFGSGGRFYGTSAAAPHAAACAALVWSAFPGLLNVDVKQRLLDHAVDLGASGYDNTYGYGRIDAQQSCDSPQFTVSGINGGSNSLLNPYVTPGDNLAELTGYVFTADQSPNKVYLNSLAFTLSGTADVNDFNNFYLYEDVNGDGVVQSGTDNLLDTQGYASTVTFSGLNYIFTNSGSTLLFVADVKSSANASHVINVALQNTSDVEAYFGVNPVATNFPFNPPDISLPVELLSFSAQAKTNSVQLTWATASEINARAFRVTRQSKSAEIEIGQMTAEGNTGSGANYTLVDGNPVRGENVNYYLYLSETDGRKVLLDSTTIKFNPPRTNQLFANFPNPFNATTKIQFTLATAGPVLLEVFDTNGRRVQKLVDTDFDAGTHFMRWNAARLSSGIYLLRIRSAAFSATRKAVLMK